MLKLGGDTKWQNVLTPALISHESARYIAQNPPPNTSQYDHKEII